VTTRRSERLILIGIAAVFISAASGDPTVPVMLAITIAGAAVGFGITKQKADSAHERLDGVAEEFQSLNKSLSGMSETLGRIDERVKALQEKP
jgi:hypothetical protein